MENVNFPIGLMYWIFLTLSWTGWHKEHEKSWIPVCDEKKKIGKSTHERGRNKKNWIIYYPMFKQNSRIAFE